MRLYILRSLLLYSLLAFLFVFAIACSGHSGRSAAPETESYIISTQLKQDTSLSQKAHSKFLSDADVKLILADTSIPMTDEGDGLYRASIEGFNPQRESFFIIAKKGNLELRNIFLASSMGTTSIDMGITDENSTALSLWLEAVVKQSSGVSNQSHSDMLEYTRDQNLVSRLNTERKDFLDSSKVEHVELKEAVHLLSERANTLAETLSSLLELYEDDKYDLPGRTLTEITDGIEVTTTTSSQETLAGDVTAKSFSLIRGGQNQFLLPVKIGNQTFLLLVDTGSNALLIFDDLIDEDNTGITRTDTEISKKFASVVRTGVLGKAEVQIGAYRAPDMRIMLVQNPIPTADPSLTPKGADGIIGLRRTDGLSFSLDNVPLDVPLAALEPAITIFELSLPETGDANLSFGTMPLLDRADSSFVFRAKTYSVADKVDSVNRSYSDLQVPFRAKSSMGEANSGELDILLDTGAVSKLTLDVLVAQQLGYSQEQGRWLLPDDEEIDFNIIGPKSTLGLLPKFKVSDISVASYFSSGVNFEAVLGINSWQNYVIGFYFVDMQSGGPDGTISFLKRQDLTHALKPTASNISADQRFIPLPGLNSNGDDGFASMDEDGDTIVFQSNRNTGLGNWDVYVYRLGEGLLSLPALNSSSEDSDPSISGDGSLVTFHSNRPGGLGDYDIYLYDILTKQFLNLPGLNSIRRERNPVVSPDGRYITFRSERWTGEDYSNIYVYDRTQQSLLPTPALKERMDWDYDPSISSDGRYIAFDNYDIQLYEVASDSFLTLPNGINTSHNELAVTLSPNADLLAYSSTGHDKAMGLFNQDIYFWDRKGSVQTFIQALNTDFNEMAAQFNGTGQYLAFHSNRPGGEGATDVYVYRLKSTGIPNDDSQATPTDLVLDKLDFGYTIEAKVNGDAQRLLIDTSASSLVLFQDRTGINPGEGEVSIPLPEGSLGGNVTPVSLNVGPLNIESMNACIVTSTDAGSLRPGIQDVDGILGLHIIRTTAQGDLSSLDTPLAVLEPPVNMLELNLNPYGTSTLSLGQRPQTGSADPDYLFTSHITKKSDAENTEKTDMIIPFVATYGGNTIGIDKECDLLLGSAQLDSLILDENLASQLGYSTESGSWEINNKLSEMLTIYLKGINSHLRIPSSYPYSAIKVLDLSSFEYDAILSLERWQDYILGFDKTPPDSGGPDAVAVMLHRGDLKAAASHKSSIDSISSFRKLTGLNSEADDSFGCISPSGEKIVFQSNRTGGQGKTDIYLYTVQASSLNTLSAMNSDTEDLRPSIDRAETTIVFQSNRKGVSMGDPNDYDIYCYDLVSEELQGGTDMPNLNTDYIERDPWLSADGKYIVYCSSDAGSFDLKLYNREKRTSVELPQLLLDISHNDSSGQERTVQMYSAEVDIGTPSISENISLPRTSIETAVGDDIRTGYLITFNSTYHFDQNTIAKGVHILRFYPDEPLDSDIFFPSAGVSSLQSSHWDTMASVSADGTFIAFDSNRHTPAAWNTGRDILLLEVSSGEFLFLPGINSLTEDGCPRLRDGASSIIYHSKRADSSGGYDLFLYDL
ncbi:MAG: PD40 domain-containing protein [Planctomycetes bacterium]|nr:PD40 domain-containing protein [Planctomycetota bacterium]